MILRLERGPRPERGPLGSLASPQKPGECERFDTGSAVLVYIHRQVLEEAREPLRVSFAFKVTGR